MRFRDANTGIGFYMSWSSLLYSPVFVAYFYGPKYSSKHYNDAMMGAMTPQIPNLTNVNLTVYSGTDQRKYQCSAALAFVWGIHRWPVNSPHKGPVTRTMFPFDDVIVISTSPWIPISWPFRSADQPRWYCLSSINLWFSTIRNGFNY